MEEPLNFTFKSSGLDQGLQKWMTSFAAASNDAIAVLSGYPYLAKRCSGSLSAHVIH
jgi:hypothetical protein